MVTLVGAALFAAGFLLVIGSATSVVARAADYPKITWFPLPDIKMVPVWTRRTKISLAGGLMLVVGGLFIYLAATNGLI
jgi:hypothetical protein